MSSFDFLSSFPCSYCEFAADTEQGLIIHEDQHVKKLNAPCASCDLPQSDTHYQQVKLEHQDGCKVESSSDVDSSMCPETSSHFSEMETVVESTHPSSNFVKHELTENELCEKKALSVSSKENLSCEETIYIHSEADKIISGSKDLEVDIAEGPCYTFGSTFSEEREMNGKVEMEELPENVLFPVEKGGNSNDDRIEESDMETEGGLSEETVISDLLKAKTITIENKNGAISSKRAYSVSYSCWICFKTFPHCLDVKKHILNDHSKALCSLGQLEVDGPHNKIHLLLFCPRKCNYFTSRTDAFNGHISACKRAEINAGVQDYIEIQNDFISKEYLELQEKVASGAISNLMERHRNSTQDSVESSNTGHCAKTNSEDIHEGLTADISSSSIEQKTTTSRDDKTPDTNNSETLSNDTHHSCPTCHKSFATASDLGKHFRCEHSGEEQDNLSQFNGRPGPRPKKPLPGQAAAHARKWRFKCDECGRAFSRNSHLERHKSIHTGEKPFECGECGMKFGQGGQMNLHMRTHTGEKPFNCGECGKGFSRGSHLDLHMRTHTGEKPFECSQCGNRFCQSSQLRIHMRIHTHEKPFSCNLCGKRFTRNSHVNIHMRTHTGEKSYKCEECGKGFVQSSQLYTHMRIHARDNKLFQCTKCGKTLRKKGLAVPKQSKCDECGKGSSSQDGESDNSTSSQSEERPFMCNECGGTFVHKSQLCIHMRTHTGEKPFACSECGRTFTQSGHLTTHMRTHTGEKPFKCKECDKTFSQNGQLQSHMKTHGSMKPFKCKECPKSFSARRYLRVHLKTHESKGIDSTKQETKLILSSA